MAKDWKQVAKAQKREMAEMKATIRKWQRMYARLEKAGWVALRRATHAGAADDVTLLEAADKASLFYFRETVRLGKLVKRLEAKKA
jgi:uncharacterized protein (DUF305 family)